MPKDAYLDGLKSERARSAEMLAALKGPHRKAGLIEARVHDLKRRIAILDSLLGKAVAVAEVRPARKTWSLRLGRFLTGAGRADANL